MGFLQSQKLMIHLENVTIPSANNKIKNIFQKIFPKHVKNMKIELGLLKRFMLKLNHWNINNENEKKYTLEIKFFQFLFCFLFND